MALSPEEIAVLQQRLAEAELARHRLLIGESVTIERHDGRHAEYRPANLAALDAYIAELRRLIAGTKARRRTIRAYQSGTGL